MVNFPGLTAVRSPAVRSTAGPDAARASIARGPEGPPITRTGSHTRLDPESGTTQNQGTTQTMPTYDYECPKGHRFELFQRISDDPGATCPECGAEARRLISGGAGFLFKGEGFYITDYRSEDYKKKAAKEPGTAAAGGSGGAASGSDAGGSSPSGGDTASGGGSASSSGGGSEPSSTGGSGGGSTSGSGGGSTSGGSSESKDS